MLKTLTDFGNCCELLPIVENGHSRGFSRFLQEFRRRGHAKEETAQLALHWIFYEKKKKEVVR